MNNIYFPPELTRLQTGKEEILYVWGIPSCVPEPYYIPTHICSADMYAFKIKYTKRYVCLVNLPDSLNIDCYLCPAMQCVENYFKIVVRQLHTHTHKTNPTP